MTGVFEKMVVGWNGSDSSRRALQWALAHADGIPLVVVHVVPGRARSSDGLPAGGQLIEARAQLLEATDDIRERHPELRLTTVTVQGDPLEELDDYVAAGTLTVVGARTRGRPGRWSFGGRLAGQPGAGAVAVIPDEYGASERSGVIVGVDGSATSIDAIAIAADEAKRSGEAVTLVHAWEPPSLWESAYDEHAEGIGMVEEMHRQILDDALAFANALDAAPRGRLEQGGAAEVLLAESRDASVLVIGSHGRSRVARFLLGSVSQDVLLAVTTPTIIVRPDQ
ncbi:universal stress protein [Agromyces humi]|uniref:universal stress protein n=1 Tax=Agromyces humi TaxID=1766800 RepID=UPI00135C511E|nr:universal stress protein [Agromyces humi]